MENVTNFCKTVETGVDPRLGHQQARDRSSFLEVSFLDLLLPRRSPGQEYRFLYKLQLIFLKP